MSKYISGNQKHLTLEDRTYIENELDKGTSFKDIARFQCKDPATISKEIKAHRLSDWNIDLKCKVRSKPRKCHKTQITNRAVFTNRLYSDFCNLVLPSYVEMDTVHSQDCG